MLSAGSGTGAGGDNERAVGVLSSGSRTPAIGVEIVNNSGAALASVTISFTQELWRTAGDAGSPPPIGEENITTAAWSQTGAAGVTSANYLSVTTGFTVETDLDLVSPTPAGGDAATYVDGNLAINQTARTATIDFTTPIAVGESFFLRFQDFLNDGSDAAMAIDDFSFSATAVPEPASLGLLGISLLGILLSTNRRKR